jgi:hypothetical protein
LQRALEDVRSRPVRCRLLRKKDPKTRNRSGQSTKGPTRTECLHHVAVATSDRFNYWGLVPVATTVAAATAATVTASTATATARTAAAATWTRSALASFVHRQSATIDVVSVEGIDSRL